MSPIRLSRFPPSWMRARTEERGRNSGCESKEKPTDGCLLCRWRPEYTNRTLERIGGVPEDEIRTTIGRVPDEFMSEIAREFAFQVVMTGRRELLRSVR